MTAVLANEGADIIVPNRKCLDGCHVGADVDRVSSNEGHATQTASQVPIAICGMSVRLPGGLHSPQDFWDFLISKGDARGPVPKSRYNAAAHYSEKPKPGTISTEYGYFLDESIDISAIDTSFFNMSKAEVERTDPQQRLMLEVARECIEDAGETSRKGQRIGCYMGSFGEDWVELFAKETQQYGLYRVTGYGDFMLPNRVSYEMDLTGPSMVVRTGCSASLVALHEACMAISRGDCEGAVVGGANLIMGPGMSAAMSEQGVLSPDGSCKSFSADANGYGRGEAISAIFIKRLSDAIHDGNPVRAVIRGTGCNSDGKGTAAGIQIPNDVTQEDLIRQTYKAAGITDLSETAFVECHGTGTPTGDPIEARAVGRVFGPTGGVQIGSVKANLGHSEGASGLTSLLKAVMALENRIIPPNIRMSKPNPNIPWDSCGLSVPTEPMPWPEGRNERISVNSFGIGGTNAHVVLDSALSYGVSSVPRRSLISPQLLVYSANTTESLKRMMATYKTWVRNNPERITDLAFTLANRREHLPHRAFAVASLTGSLTPSLPLKAGKPPNIVMVFTGQGAQWPQMGRCLLQSPSYPVFRKTIQSLDAYIRTTDLAPGWTIQDELQKPADTSRLGSAEISQPLCTAIQIALVDTFTSIGVHPTAVVGHSSGEITAAYAAGSISAYEAITITFYRGHVTGLHSKCGAMAAIGMGSKDVQKYLEPGVVIACENSAMSLTLAGDAEVVKRVSSRIKEAEPDILVRLLRVDKAYHSHHMSEIGQNYYALIKQKVSAKPPNKLFFSGVTGKQLTLDNDLGAKYWQRNLESPVLFHSAISSIMQHEIANNMIFLEVGPHSALAGPLRQTLSEYSNSSPYVPTLLRNQNDVESLLAAVGALHSRNAPVDLSKAISKGTCLPDLPRYPWDHNQKFWYESRLSKEWRHREHAHHDLLGVRVTESPDFNVLFRNLFHLDNAPWVRDHRVGKDIVFPFAGYAGMIGEAIRQVTLVDEGFILRKVTISTALVLSEGSPVEITTTLSRRQWTDSLDSEWYEFSIASHNGTTWIKHCSGEVKAHGKNLGEAKRSHPLVRKVRKRRFYESMAKSGLEFGPTFQRLDDIRSETTTTNATSEVTGKEEDGIDYHVHPTVIDASLQLLSVAAFKGFANTTSKLMVPTKIEELCVSRCSEDVQLRAFASYTQTDCIVGGAQCIAADGKVVLRSSGVKLSVLDDQASVQCGEATARAEWGPHIDFLDPNALIKPSIDRSIHMPILGELAHLCMIHTKRTISGSDTSIDYMHKYRSWINRQCQSVELQRLDHLDNATIDFKVKSIVAELSHTPAAGAAVGIQKVYSNMRDIFTGDKEVLEVLLADDTLADLYAYADQCDESLFFKHLTHNKPNLRVLEIGAGTGGSTASFLKWLTPGERPLYSKYTFSDISSGFFVSARDRFSAYSNIEYLPLDISKDPADQEFEGRKYDLILATNVIHATKSLRKTLSNIRKLLDHKGRLLFHELTPSSKWVNYVWGTLAGWWYGENDCRIDQPYVSVSRWTEELKAAGFCAPDAAVPDTAAPNQLNTMILARLAIESLSRKHVTLLALAESENVRAITLGLRNRGYTIDRRGLQGPLPVGQDVIALLDDGQPFFEKLDNERFESFKVLMDQFRRCGILWLTDLCQIECKDPRFGQINGIARAIRSEMLVDFATCEVDCVSSSVDKIIDVFEKFQVREQDDVLKPEFEYAIVENTVHVGRIHPFSVHSEITESEPNDVIALRSSRPGHLTALHWVGHELEPLKDGDVEVEIHATGLNFRDVLVAVGIVGDSANGFGLEAAGIVRRTGANVASLNAGDRVMLISNCTFATCRVVSENLCEKIPDGLSFEDAATMPCVFATSIYSIFSIGNLKRGESILIHSACGGVGLATIQLAQMVGAEVYATVGNEEKVAYLMDTFQLPRNRIFNSRNASFVDDVMRETDNRGVDLALNSLSGELLHATWKCIAPFGKMVEIGKRDLIGSGKLDMSPFLENRSYCCVDLDQICFFKPTIAKELLNRLVQLLRQGYIHPIRPIKTFDSGHILDAFRYMQQGIHLGKIVVSMRNTAGQTALDETVVQHKRVTRFDSSGAYLLVGGLGGLGRSISTWMVERGARHLIYLSRSAGTTDAHLEFSQELASMGCRADFVQGTVMNLDDVTKAMTRAHGHLNGIFQMSMVLRDKSFSRMTKSEWDTAVDPKVKGTWNLHHASTSINANLDFFVMFSSLSGIIGQPGQINYA
ncbi:type I Iterative Polyketide synthase (PKS), partial [Aspergillus brasiliensis]